MKIDHRGRLADVLIADGVGERVSLPLGDVEFETKDGTHLMELKTAHDFALSLRRGHLQDQVARMNEEDVIPHLLIVGEVTGAADGWMQVEDVWSTGYNNMTEGVRAHREKRLGQVYTIKYPYAGAMNYLSHLQEDGWTVHQCSRITDFPVMVEFIHKRAQRGRRHTAKRRVPYGSLDPRANALRALPEYRHLSSKAAESLIRAGYWRDPLELTGVDTKEFLKLDGIGKISAERLAQ